YQGYLKRDEFDTRISINSDGYRGAELRLKSCADVRVLTVGDSFTFGFGVNDEETFSARIGKELQDVGLKVEVINAGFASGYSPDTYYLFLKDRLPRFRTLINLVLVGFFLGNDIDGYSENIWPETQDGLPLRIVNTQARIDEEGYMVPRSQSFAYSTPVWRNS